MDFERLDEDYTQIDNKWYATVSRIFGNYKQVEFNMWSGVNYKGYIAFYYDDNKVITFENSAISEELNTIDLLEKMIAFIRSDTFKNIEFSDDQNENFVYEIGYS